jgi:hypothetical protein
MRFYYIQQRQQGVGPLPVSPSYTVADEHWRHFRDDRELKRDFAKAGNADAFQGKVDELIAGTLKLIDRLLEAVNCLQHEFKTDSIAAERFANAYGSPQKLFLSNYKYPPRDSAVIVLKGGAGQKGQAGLASHLGTGTSSGDGPEKMVVNSRQTKR